MFKPDINSNFKYKDYWKLSKLSKSKPKTLTTIQVLNIFWLTKSLTPASTKKTEVVKTHNITIPLLEALSSKIYPKTATDNSTWQVYP